MQGGENMFKAINEINSVQVESKGACIFCDEKDTNNCVWCDGQAMDWVK